VLRLVKFAVNYAVKSVNYVHVSDWC